MRGIAQVLLVCCTVAAAAPAHANCTQNTDCHIGEVCEQGVCVTPPVSEGSMRSAPEEMPPLRRPHSYHLLNPELRTAGIIMFSVGLPVAVGGLVLTALGTIAYAQWATNPASTDASNPRPLIVAGAIIAPVATLTWVTGIVFWIVGSVHVRDKTASWMPTFQPLPNGGAFGLSATF